MKNIKRWRFFPPFLLCLVSWIDVGISHLQAATNSNSGIGWTQPTLHGYMASINQNYKTGINPHKIKASVDLIHFV